jgi:hypothetical protein
VNTKPPRYADLTPAQREAFDTRYGKPSRTRRDDEHKAQVAFFAAVDANPYLHGIPIFAIPNGGHRRSRSPRRRRRRDDAD